MSSTVELEVAENYRGNILVVGTGDVGVAKHLLPEDSQYEDVVTGWFMRLDGHFAHAGSKHQPGTVRGVQFRQVSTNSKPETVSLEDAAHILGIMAQDVRKLTHSGVIEVISDGDPQSPCIDRGSVTRHVLPRAWGVIDDISVQIGVNQHHIQSLVDAGKVRSRSDILGRTVVSGADVRWALNQHRA